MSDTLQQGDLTINEKGNVSITKVIGLPLNMLPQKRKQYFPCVSVAYPGILFGGWGGLNKFTSGQRTERTGIWGTVAP